LVKKLLLIVAKKKFLLDPRNIQAKQTDGAWLNRKRRKKDYSSG
jgi:hypothetical protein